ncbi:hypothetical protein E2C01_072541 [Portunus trituberculatus]|uniref:Uncharacterized protein n=1 Tax=Portunus trituberculatus TaxID=210409 RepID=A0A5B7I982_PORTR|nr:hypothetical protein [Portunus trituberculatus]
MSFIVAVTLAAPTPVQPTVSGQVAFRTGLSPRISLPCILFLEGARLLLTKLCAGAAIGRCCFNKPSRRPSAGHRKPAAGIVMLTAAGDGLFMFHDGRNDTA